MTGQTPFISDNKDMLQRKIIKSEPYQDECMDSKIVEFVKYALIKDQFERPDIYELKKQPLFNDIDWTKVSQLKYESPIMNQLNNKFDINRIHDYYADKKPSKHTDFFYEKARDELKTKLRKARREYLDYYYNYATEIND